MGRPRSFDESKAVADAAGVFRSRGYTAASVDDLVTATGVHRASLYGTFGSKYGLFLRVLDQAGAALVADPHDEDAVDVLLVALMDLAPDDPPLRGRVAHLVSAVALTPNRLGARLMARAGLHPTTEESP